MQEVQKRGILGLQRKQYSDVEVEEGLDTLALVLDDLFRVPGTHWRFGLNTVIDLVPGFGDTLAALASLFILFAGVRYGVPKITLLRMALNIALGYLIGVIPFVGSVFYMFWKPNRTNMKLIRMRATGKGKSTKGDYFFIFGLIALLLMMVLGTLTALGVIFYYIFTSRPLI